MFQLNKEAGTTLVIITHDLDLANRTQQILRLKGGKILSNERTLARLMRNIPSKASVQWLFKMAWRDGKASSSRLMLFMASIILGIAAVVSIQLFSDNLKQNIKDQSKGFNGCRFYY